VKYSKWEWVVSALELIGREKTVRRFCYALLVALVLSVALYSLPPVLVALVNKM
jgi:hypothetical protein